MCDQPHRLLKQNDCLVKIEGSRKFQLDNPIENLIDNKKTITFLRNEIQSFNCHGKQEYIIHTV